MTMADEPTQEGTPSTKANLLSDATAAKLNGVETPNAAFDLLSRFHAGLGNEYVWIRSDGTFVNSPDSDAYPSAVSDGYTYTALGQIGNRARISSVSYTGTGVSGASNPTVLSADFNVKIAIIIQKTSKANHAIIVDTTGFYLQSGISQPYMLTAISHTDGISFYSNATAEQQCNFSGYVYEAILIG